MYNYQYPQFTDCRPDPQEKRQLRKYYFRLAWIIIALIFVFNLLNTALMYIASAIMGGGFSAEQIENGKEIFSSDPILRTIYSYGFPVAGDIAAVITGLMITKCDLKRMLTVKNVSGKDFAGFTALSFGIVTVGSFVNIIIIAVAALLSGDLSDFSVDSVSSVNIAPQNNPLWLDVVVYVYICLLGPILEELIFRGVLLEGLRKYGNLFGIIMSSVMFGLVHQNIAQCFPAFCMGLAWAFMAIKTGSVIPSIIVHILNNTMSAVLMVMLESVDIDALYNMTDMSDITGSYVWLIIVLCLNMLLRLICIIASIVITVRFFASGKRLIQTDIYSRHRTWGYLFTSAPWLIVILFLTASTLTSL